MTGKTDKEDRKEKRILPFLSLKKKNQKCIKFIFEHQYKENY